MRPAARTARRGFTLIELLLVVAILATIAGGVLVAYDGLETDAAQGTATYNISAIDKAVRTYKTLNKVHPNELDSLLFTATGDATDATALNLLNSKLRGKLGRLALDQPARAALIAAGITRLRYASGALATPLTPYNNATDGTGTSPQIPNRVFDAPTSTTAAQARGWGVAVTLDPAAAGAQVVVPVVETSNNGTGGVQAFSASALPNSSVRLREIAGLDENRIHYVVVLGLGNNSTMVAESGLNGATGVLSEAPFYTNIAKNEYGRYLLCYLIATDTNDDGAVAANEYLTEARFVACLDTKGDWLDEELAEYTNQKP